MTADLHRAFTAPAGSDAEGIEHFLHRVERLPGIRRIRSAMRAALPADLTGRTVVDLGCGTGWEAERIAAAHPAARVIGVDHNAELIAAARARTPAGRPEWVCADVSESGCEPGSVDVVRTDRVLMYMADLPAAAAVVTELLGPSGRIVSFELDYGSTVLAPGSARPEVLQQVQEYFESALPQPWAGRQLPGLLDRHGLTVSSEPYSFALDDVVWRRIVRDTVAAGVAERALDGPPVEAWLTELDDPDFPTFRAIITGVLTTALASRAE